MRSLFIIICAVAGLCEGSPFPPGLFRHMRTIDDYPKVAHLPPVRRRFEAWVGKWRSEHEECGRQAIKPFNPYFKIVGGREVRRGSWPWMISLRFDGRGIHMLWCAASLIDKQWLVTAAHCFNKMSETLDMSDPTTWTIQLGKHDANFGVIDETEVDRRISKLYLHPKVNEGSLYNNDIALIKLDEPVELNEYISPICLPAPRMKFEGGTECVVTGWGITENPGTDSHVLRQAAVPIIPYSDCRKLPHFSVVTPNMMCAGYLAGGADACNFDSGGPIQCQKDANWHLAGITSYGYNNTCGQPSKPGVYTDVTKYLDWIYWHIFLDPYF